MPIIQFDVLVPDDSAHRVAEVFTAATDKLIANGELGGASVEHQAHPDLLPGVDEQLRETYSQEHEERELTNASVHRYTIAATRPSGSLNQLAMVLSRLLTPHAVLPKDHVMLEDELAHERPAIFPWTLDVIP